jgi:hypothetical protein
MKIKCSGLHLFLIYLQNKSNWFTSYSPSVLGNPIKLLNENYII